MICPMSHDRSNNSVPYETPTPKLHSGFFESIIYTAYMLIGVIVLAPIVLMWPNRKS